MADTLLDAAYADLVVVDLLLHRPITDDDCTLGIAGYHLSQSVEKSLKAVLEFVGQDYRALRHSIAKCLRSVSNHAPDVLDDEIVAKLLPQVNLLTDWESAGRYPSDFLFTLKELCMIQAIAIELYNNCAKYLGEKCFTSVVSKPGHRDVGRMSLESKYHPKSLESDLEK